MEKYFMIILVMLILLTGLTIIKDEMLKQSSAELFFFNQTKSNKSVSNTSINPICNNCSSVKLDRFSIEVVKIVQDSMLSRIITAKIKANEDVKNLVARIQLYVGNQKIKVNDKDEIEVYIGNMKSGEEIERDIRISIGIFSAMKVKQEGQVDLLLTLSFDGGKEEIRVPVKIV